MDVPGPDDVSTWQLAQVNVARLRAPLDDPVMAGLSSALDQLNRLAEASSGFVWRLPTGHHRPLSDEHAGPMVFTNVSVWTSYACLHNYVYRSAHGRYGRQRSRWFLPSSAPSTALWWISTGQYPTLDDAFRRLAYLRRYGPSPKAFTVRRRFTADGHREGQRLGG